MDEINKMIFGKVLPDTTEKTYEDLRLYFEEDYDRNNPATRGLARAKYEKDVRASAHKEEFNHRFMHKFFGEKENHLQHFQHLLGGALGGALGKQGGGTGIFGGTQGTNEP
mmetsp:Transcript_59323/g.68699  ORF Transcript_59323/g.68699 Transcript_59323/m.68699 type:complete len:111 (+) Transcript_59323:1-333(+)